MDILVFLAKVSTQKGGQEGMFWPLKSDAGQLPLEGGGTYWRRTFLSKGRNVRDGTPTAAGQGLAKWEEGKGRPRASGPSPWVCAGVRGDGGCYG